MATRVLIFGASARAAAFSALRAGLDPWSVDLFSDADLESRCFVHRIAGKDYPEGFVEIARWAPQGPWLYTGGLENHPQLVARISEHRRVWGMNTGLESARAPEFMTWVLERAGIPCPRVQLRPPSPDPAKRWLVKPRRGAGGTGIRSWDGRTLRPERDVYFQEFINGDACAALYLGGEHQVRLLGITAQLVGEDWLHASPFHYCGSIGPLTPGDATLRAVQRLGAALHGALGIRGLFGVDCVLRDGVPFPVEINPRYTASVEVLEYATGLPALALHRAVFDPTAPVLSAPTEGRNDVIGKAILFARTALTFPADGPWMATLRQPGDVNELPAFADIPHPGTPVKAGRPVLTFFARADSLERCRSALQEIARELDRWLFESARS